VSAPEQTLIDRIRKRRDARRAELGLVPPELAHESALLDEIDRLRKANSDLEDRLDDMSWHQMGDDL
jgi:hypothetical protein